MATHIRWSGGNDSHHSSSSSSYPSDSSSARTNTTTHTEYSVRPAIPRYGTCHGRVESSYDSSYSDCYDDAHSSTDGYPSTIASDDELSDLEEDDDEDEYDLPEFSDELYHSDAIPSTARDFADFFPSHRKFSIRHDDATMDGNMNLRLDTEVETRSGRRRPLTLFHLRMLDLKTRDFSLRRYCRDSGREVCHCVRKYQKPARPALQKSFSSALAPFRKNEASHLKRHDSGYGSLVDDEVDAPSQASLQSKKAPRMPTNTIKLEFSNYAQVDVRRRGAGSSKRYDFEYWGVTYSWRRHLCHDGNSEEVSFHLVRDDRDYSLAHIVPTALTSVQAQEEKLKGGWIPPCSMWISDPEIVHGLPDAADVIVASGLIALVDDAIKRRWHSRSGRQVLLPISRGSSFRMNMEYVGPKRLIDEVFHRIGHSQHESAQTQRRRMPRRAAVEA